MTITFAQDFRLPGLPHRRRVAPIVAEPDVADVVFVVEKHKLVDSGRIPKNLFFRPLAKPEQPAEQWVEAWKKKVMGSKPSDSQSLVPKSA